MCIYRVFVAYLLHVLSPISPWPICSCKVCAHGCFVSQCWPAPSGNRAVKIIATVRVNKGSILFCGSMRLSVGPDKEVCRNSYAVTFKARHFSLQKENLHYWRGQGQFRLTLTKDKSVLFCVTFISTCGWKWFGCNMLDLYLFPSSCTVCMKTLFLLLMSPLTFKLYELCPSNDIIRIKVHLCTGAGVKYCSLV